LYKMDYRVFVEHVGSVDISRVDDFDSWDVRI